MPSSSIDITVSSELKSLKNWEAFVPTDVNLDTPVSGSVSIPGEYVVPIVSNYDFDIPNRYYVPTLVSGVYDLENAFSTGSIALSASDVTFDFSLKQQIQGHVSVNTDFNIYLTRLGFYSTYVDFKLWSTNYASLKDTDVAIRIRYPFTVVDTTDVLANLWAMTSYPIRSEIFSSNVSVSGISNVEVHTASGIVNTFDSSFFSTAADTQNFGSTVYSTNLDTISNFYLDSKITGGGTLSFYSDVFLTKLTSNTLGTDIRTRSLFIQNFSPIEDEYVSTTSGVVSFEVVDFLYNVIASGTYFKVDGKKVPTLLQPIPNGYVAFCSASGTPDDYFVYTAHAENSIGDILEQDYYFRNGVLVTSFVRERFGLNQKVDVLIRASNKAECAAAISESFYYTTRDYLSRDLRSSISVIRSYNLGGYLKARSKALIKGGEYTLTVSGIKDYAGNYLPPIKYKFIVE